MKHLYYQIEINASKSEVWNALIDLEKFKIWTQAFSPKSYFEGQWKQGEEISFIDADRGGTVAKIDEFIPYDRIVATHIATLTKDLVRETTGEFTENWIGTKETYVLEENAGKTTLKIEMQSHPDFTEMFENSWPKALKDLKKVVEQSK